MKKIALSALLALGVSGMAQAAYIPVGPQTNVALSTVLNGGWTQCYIATMNVAIGVSGENVLNACQGDQLMMAGRVTGSKTLLVLAAADRADTIFNTGRSATATHLANGSKWWYSPSWSWGFTAANDTVQNGSCNTDASSPTSMCLHTNASVGGYRIDDIKFLNSSTTYEKLFFVNTAVTVPEPAPLALLGLGLLGLAASRKRKA